MSAPVTTVRPPTALAVLLAVAALLLIGSGVSGVFLYLIAASNLVILVGILKIFRQMRSGSYDESALDTHLNNRGLINRVFGRFTRSITKSWQMYPHGSTSSMASAGEGDS